MARSRIADGRRSRQDRRMAHPSAAISGALSALVGYAQQAGPTHADIDRVMRALTEHDDWFVPVALADEVWPHGDEPLLDLFVEAVPTKVLTVFTDEESAGLAARYPLGQYVGGVPGVALLGALDDRFTDLVVNPASPREHQWYVSSAGFAIANHWAASVGVERALAATRSADPPPIAALRSFTGFRLLFSRDDGGLATVYLPDVPGPLAMGFLAADRAEEFLDGIGSDGRYAAHLVELDGVATFELLRDERVAGVVLNAGAERQYVLFRMDIVAIADKLTPVG
jgi:hypothetical protein